MSEATGSTAMTLQELVLTGSFHDLKGRLAQAMQDGTMETYGKQVIVFKGWHRWLFWRRPRTELSTARWKAFEMRELDFNSEVSEPTFDYEVQLFFVSDQGELAMFNQFVLGGVVVVSQEEPKTVGDLLHWVTGIKSILEDQKQELDDGRVYFAIY